MKKMFSRRVVALVIISLGALSNFYLLFPVVPMMAIRFGADAGAAGICAATLMLFTILVEPITPLLLRRLRVRPIFATGLLMLGVPALLPIIAPSLPSMMVSCALRGAGLGLILVSETAVLASELPTERRGEGLGLYGVVIGIPSLLFLPFGIGLTQLIGPTLVFAIAAAMALAPIVAVPMLPPTVATGDVDRVRPLAGAASMIRQALPFATTTIAIGVISAFLPLTSVAPDVAVAALFVQSCTTPVARWLAGRLARRVVPKRLMVPALLISAAGVAALVLVREPLAAIIGMAVFGIGFGVAQSASLSILLDHGGPAGYDRASAIWNLAYDGGMGLGSGGFGILVGAIGFSGGFAATAALIAVSAAVVVAAPRAHPAPAAHPTPPPSGSKYLTLAFLQTETAGSCNLYWTGNTATPVAASTFGAEINQIRRVGGDVVPSFGGYTADTTNTEIADSCTDVDKITLAYEKVVTTCQVQRLDFDIEADSFSNVAGIDRRNHAIREVENWAARQHRELSIAYTLPSTPQGLGATGVAVLQSAAKYHAPIAGVNVMTFDYWDGATPRHARRRRDCGGGARVPAAPDDRETKIGAGAPSARPRRPPSEYRRRCGVT